MHGRVKTSSGFVLAALVLTVQLTACHMPRFGPPLPSEPKPGSGKITGTVTFRIPQLQVYASDPADSAPVSEGMLQPWPDYHIAAFLEDYDLPGDHVEVSSQRVQLDPVTWRQAFALQHLHHGDYHLGLVEIYDTFSSSRIGYLRTANELELRLPETGAQLSDVDYVVDLGGREAGGALEARVHWSGVYIHGQELGLNMSRVQDHYDPGLATPSANFSYLAPDCRYGRFYLRLEQLSPGAYLVSPAYGPSLDYPSGGYFQNGSPLSDAVSVSGSGVSSFDAYLNFMQTEAVLDTTAPDYPYEHARVHGSIECILQIEPGADWGGDVLISAERLDGAERAWKHLTPTELATGGSLVTELRYLPSGSYTVRALRLGRDDNDPVTELARAGQDVTIPLPRPESYYFVVDTPKVRLSINAPQRLARKS